MQVDVAHSDIKVYGGLSIIDSYYGIFMYSNMVAWPSGLRRWFKAPVSSEALVRIPPLPNTF